MLIAFDLDDTIIDTSGSVTPYKLQEFLRFSDSVAASESVASDQAFQETAALDQRCGSSKETVRLTLERFQALHLFEEAMASIFRTIA